jgi:hypothetical protein
MFFPPAGLGLEDIGWSAHAASIKDSPLSSARNLSFDIEQSQKVAGASVTHLEREQRPPKLERSVIVRAAAREPVPERAFNIPAILMAATVARLALS